MLTRREKKRRRKKEEEEDRKNLFLQLFAVPHFIDILLNRRPGDDYDPGDILNLISIAKSAKSVRQEVERCFPPFVFLERKKQVGFWDLVTELPDVCRLGYRNLRRLVIGCDDACLIYSSRLTALQSLVQLEELAFEDFFVLQKITPRGLREPIDAIELPFDDLDRSRRELEFKPEIFSFLSQMPKLESLQLPPGQPFRACKQGSDRACPLQYFIQTLMALKKLTHLSLVCDGPMSRDCACSQQGAGVPQRVQWLEVTVETPEESTYDQSLANRGHLKKRVELLAQRQSEYQRLVLQYKKFPIQPLLVLSVVPRCLALGLQNVEIRPELSAGRPALTKTLYFHFLADNDLPFLQSVSKQLECLSLGSVRLSPTDSLVSLPDFPKLQHLHITFPNPWGRTHVSDYWGQMSCSGIAGVFQTIVKKMPNLRTLSVKFFDFAARTRRKKFQRTYACLTALPNLHTLAIIDCQYYRFTRDLKGCAAVLDLIESIPSLKRFVFSSNLIVPFDKLTNANQSKNEYNSKSDSDSDSDADTDAATPSHYIAVMNRARRVLGSLDYVSTEGDGWVVLANKRRGVTIDAEIDAEIAKAIAKI